MAEQIKFGDRLFLRGEKVFLDNGNTDAVLESRSGNLVIKGNLTVDGTTTTVNSETVSIADPFMLLNGDHTGAASEDVGIEINRGSDANKKFGWDETNGRWDTFGDDINVNKLFVSNVDVSGSLTGNIDAENGGTIIDVTGDGSIDVESGNIDGTVIGATTPEAGTFTTLTWSTTTNTTDDLNEGTTNLYYTDARARASISVSGTELSYDSATGVITFTPDYYDDVDARLSISVQGNEIAYDNTTGVISYDAPTDFGLITETSNVISGSTGGSPGSSLPTNVGSFTNDAGYITGSYAGFQTVTQSATDHATTLASAQALVDAVVDVAPLQLDTLKKLANAINNDANYNTNITTLIGTKANTSSLSTVATTGSYLDLTNTPTIPTQISDLPNDAGFITSSAIPTNFMVTDATNTVSGSQIPSTDNTYDLGSTTNQWRKIFGHEVEATYADLAERYEADAEYEPGTVVIFGGEKEITTKDVCEADSRVAGVISSNPAIKMNSDAGEDSTHPYLALRGRVPCKVEGPVKKGDMLVTSATPGVAKSIGRVDMGHSVFAKSLTNDLTETTRIIEVVIL